MASEQATRRENTSDEREIHAEEDRVSKMTTHFESLADKVRGLEFAGGREEGQEEREKKISEPTDEETIPRGVGKFEMHGKEEKGSGRETSTDMKAQADKEKSGSFERNEEEGGVDERERPSLEEISNYRATAQQNSMEAIRAAEERYQKAKELGTSTLQNIKESAGQTAEQAKNAIPSATGTVVHYVGEKAAEAKDVTVDLSKKVASYTGEKAAVAKEVAVETGKSVAGYAGEVAGSVKDRAVVAGWGATHYACEKTEEATKAAADVAQEVAGYAGEKAAAAKDVVASGGQSAMHYAGEKVAAAKDAVVATEESAKEYAARKKAEAEKELEAKKSAQPKVETGGQVASEEQQGIALGGGGGGAKREDEKEVKSMETGLLQEGEGEGDQGASEKERREQGGGGHGVLQAIGETVVEIAQTTKELVAGRKTTEAAAAMRVVNGMDDDTKSK